MWKDKYWGCIPIYFPLTQCDVWHDLDYLLDNRSDFGEWFPLERYEYDWYLYDKTVPCDFWVQVELLGLFVYFPCTLVRGQDILMPG